MKRKDIRDLFLGIKNVPVFGYVRVGNQYVEDAGSEVANGTTNYTFMEAPAPNSSMFTSRRVGITSRHMFAKDNARLFFGIYDAEDISASHSSVKDKQNIILNARFTHSPWFCNDGRQMFLYGGYYAYTHNFEGSKGIKPGNWNVGYSVFDTGTITTDGMHKAGFELVYQDGPLCLQSDWYVQQFSGVDQVGGDDRTNYGGFLMASYFLTGDYRKYNRQSGSWGGVDVCSPFAMMERGGVSYFRGCGAWELAAVYGYGKFDDFAPNTKYGNDHEIGLALNWYWNSQVKWSLNYIHQYSDLKNRTNNGADIKTLKAHTDILGVSCRVAF